MAVDENPCPKTLTEYYGAAAAKSQWKEIILRHGADASPFEFALYEQLASGMLMERKVQLSVKKNGIMTKYGDQKVVNPLMTQLYKIRHDNRQLLKELNRVQVAKDKKTPKKRVGQRKR